MNWWRAKAVKSVEVGRAAMGVIYKSFAVDLHKSFPTPKELLGAIPTLGA
jgi:hypothetical protein